MSGWAYGMGLGHGAAVGLLLGGWIVSCTGARQQLTVETLDTARKVIQAHQLAQSKACTDRYLPDEEKVRACWDRVDEELDPTWEKYETARLAVEAGKDATEAYCQVAEVVPEVPSAEICSR